MRLTKSAIFIIGLLAAGCASQPRAVIEERNQSVTRHVGAAPRSQQLTPQANTAAVGDPHTNTPYDSIPAVQQLLRAVDAALANGAISAATANIDHAMRIAPNDPWVWHKMAQVRLAAGDHAQAKSLAARSTALAARGSAVAAANQRLIADLERGAGHEEH